MIMTYALRLFKAEAFHRDILSIEVAVASLGDAGGDFRYCIMRRKDGIGIARARTGLVFFDHRRRKVVRTPSKFREIFASAVIEEPSSPEE